MNKMIKTFCALAVLASVSSVALAKLPAASDEAKAKAAQAAAKTAWAGKVEGYQLCLSQDKVVAYYKKTPASKAEKGAAKAAAPASACVDPGAFVYTPNVAAAPVVVAQPAPSTAAVAKKP